MFLLNWYKEFLEIKYEKKAKAKELEYCSACETLKIQLALANDERKMLIDRLTNKVEIPEPKVDTNNLLPLNPARMSWNIRRQHLEAESREAAKRLKKNLDETNSGTAAKKALTVNEIERELGVEEVVNSND